jgi:hypothetical protein
MLRWRDDAVFGTRGLAIRRAGRQSVGPSVNWPIAAGKEGPQLPVAIGAGAGLLLGLVMGGIDASMSGPRISVHADADGPGPEGPTAMGAPWAAYARRY